MTGASGPEWEPPSWEVLVSHHLPRRYDRTLCVTFPGKKSIHFCARCTGQILGVLVYLAFWIAGSSLSFSIFVPAIQLLFVLAPLPAAVDWLTQSLYRRESSNVIRLASGLLLGMAWIDLLFLLLREEWPWFLAGVLVLALYVGILALVLKLTGGWRGVLAEHFPGIEI